MKYIPRKYKMKSKKAKENKTCIDCNELLTKKNWYKHNGNLYSRCVACKRIYVRKQNDRKKKILKNFKLW